MLLPRSKEYDHQKIMDTVDVGKTWCWNRPYDSWGHILRRVFTFQRAILDIIICTYTVYIYIYACMRSLCTHYIYMYTPEPPLYNVSTYIQLSNRRTIYYLTYILDPEQLLHHTVNFPTISLRGQWHIWPSLSTNYYLMDY